MTSQVFVSVWKHIRSLGNGQFTSKKLRTKKLQLEIRITYNIINEKNNNPLADIIVPQEILLFIIITILFIDHLIFCIYFGGKVVFSP
jgi:hypothetical protein